MSGQLKLKYVSNLTYLELKECPIARVADLRFMRAQLETLVCTNNSVDQLQV